MTTDSSAGLQIEFSAVGEEQVVAALDATKKGLDEIDAALKKRAELERALFAEAAENMRKERIERLRAGDARVRDEERIAERSAAAMREFDKAARQSRSSFSEFGTSVAGVGSTMHGLRPALGEFRAGVAGIGQVFSAVVPEAGKAISAVGGFGSSIASSVTSLGPWGIAIGVVTAGLGYMAAGIRDADEEARKWTERLANDTIPTLEEFIQKINAATHAAHVQQLRGMNLAGATDAQARQNQLAEQLQGAVGRRAALAARAQGAGHTYADFEALDRADAEIARLRRESERARSEFQQARDEDLAIQNEENLNAAGLNADGTPMTRAQREALGLSAPGSASARRGGGGQRRRQSARVYADLGAFSSQGYADSEATDAIRRFLAQSGNAKSNDNDVTRIDAQRRMEDEARAQQLEQERQWYAERTRQRDEYYDGWEAKGAQVGEAFGGVLDAVASGEQSILQAGENALKQFLKSTAKSESIEAGKAFAKSFGATFVNPSAAGGYVAEGIAHLAVAGAAGGAQRIVGGAGGGAAGADGDRARPDRIGGDSVRNGGAVTINVNAPAVITEGGRGELAATIGGALRDWQWRTGEAA